MSSRIRCALAGVLLLSACNGQTANQAAANSATASEETIEDADTRAGHLADQAASLKAEAARATGARRQALQNEASEDLSSAVNVEREGQADAENIADTH